MGNTEGIDMVSIATPSRFWPSRFGRAETAGVAVMQRAQQQVLEVNLVDSFGLAPQRDRLTGEGFTDGAQAPLPFDLAVVADVAHGPAAPITDGLWSAITPAAGMIELGGIPSAQGFMGPGGVVE